MTEFGGPAKPFDGGVSFAGDDHEYRFWDAAYVLGSLSASERHEYEAHLSSCQPCREAVVEISGMPALLSRLDHDEVAAIDERHNGSSATPPMRPELLMSVLAKAQWRRRRLRLATWTFKIGRASCRERV